MESALPLPPDFQPVRTDKQSGEMEVVDQFEATFPGIAGAGIVLRFDRHVEDSGRSTIEGFALLRHFEHHTAVGVSGAPYSHLGPRAADGGLSLVFVIVVFHAPRPVVAEGNDGLGGMADAVKPAVDGRAVQYGVQSGFIEHL